MASLMANVQSVFSTPPFIGLLAPFGSSQDQYLIERRQRALAASRDNAIHCSVGACLEMGAGLQRMKAAWLGLVPDAQALSLQQSPSLDYLPSHESSPALLAQHSNKLMRINF